MIDLQKQGLPEFTEDAAKDFIAQFGLQNIEDLPQNQIDRLKQALVEHYEDKAKFVNVARRMGIDNDRADLIYDNEMHDATSNAELDSARELGATTKTWVASGESNMCKECWEMHGQTVPVGKKFSNGLMVAHKHPGCNCKLIFGYQKSFTKNEGDSLSEHSDCMSRKIKLLMDEGKYTKDQVLAIAYSYCGESRKAADLSIDQIHIPSSPQAPSDCYIAHSMLIGETKASGDYRTAIDQSQDPELKSILQELAADEADHAKKLATWIEAHPKTIETEKAIEVKKSFKSPILKYSEEEQKIWGQVLIPAPYVDLQGDMIPVSEIENAAHGFLEKARKFTRQHGNEVKAAIVESYIAPVDFLMNGQEVVKGTWIVGVHVQDKNIWNEIKSGALNAFSIGGHGIREPLSSLDNS